MELAIQPPSRWASRFRRLVGDYERLPEILARLHFVAFACLMLHRLLPVALVHITLYAAAILSIPASATAAWAVEDSAGARVVAGW